MWKDEEEMCGGMRRKDEEEMCGGMSELGVKGGTEDEEVSRRGYVCKHERKQTNKYTEKDQILVS